MQGSAPGSPPGPLRRAVPAVVVLLALVLCLALAAWWVVGTQAGLQWLTQRAVAAGAGGLAGEGVEGSVLGGVRVDRLAWEDADRHVQAEGVRLDWSPTGLLAGRVDIATLEARRLTVRLKPSAAAPNEGPATLALPLEVAIARLAVGEVEVQPAQGLPQRLRDGTGRYAYRAGRHEVAFAAALQSVGGLDVQLGVADARPFAVDGRVTLVADRAGGVRAQARIDGNLLAPTVVAQAQGSAWRAEGTARLAPFSAVPVSAATLRTAALDLAALVEGAPATALDIRLDAHGQPDGALAGEIAVANALAGSLDRQRVPLSRLVSAFRQEADGLAFERTVIDGAGGRLTGAGSLRDGRLAFDFAASSLDLRALYGRLAATRLSGPLRLLADGQRQRLDVDLRQPGWRIVAAGDHDGVATKLETLQLTLPGGALRASGRYAAADGHFEAAGTVQGFDPSRLGRWPAGRIHARFAADGALRPAWRAALRLTVRDSVWRGAPLAAEADLGLSAGRVAARVFEVRLGSLVARAAGAFGGVGDRLSFNLQAPDLRQLHPDLAGSVDGEGQLSGTPTRPGVELTARAAKLAWGEVGLREAHLAAGIAEGEDGALRLDLSAEGVRGGAWEIATLSLRGDGRRSAHTAHLNATGAGQRLDAEVRGAWLGEAGWRGELTALDVAGTLPVRLEGALPLALGAGRVAAGPGHLRLGDGRLRLASLSMDERGVATEGDFRGVSLRALPLALESRGLASNVVVAGEWRLRLGERADGTLRVWRESGDFSIAAGRQPLPLGLRELGLTLALDDGRVKLNAQALGDTVGSFNAALETALARGDGGWRLPPGAPLQLQASAGMPSLGWTRLLLPPGVTVAGAVGLQVSGSGTLGQPRLAGELRAAGLRLEMVEQGVDLRDGLLVARFDGDRVRVEEFVLSGGAGVLNVSGDLALPGGDPQAALALKATHLTLVSRPDRLLVASGDGTLKLVKGTLSAAGAFAVDEGLIELARLDDVAVSDDVVVRGRPQEKPAAAGIAARADVSVDLGDAFRLRGHGLETRLTGRLRLRAEPGRLPTATGVVRAADGTYAAYGQKLSVERGLLSFNGALDDPALDVVALRKNLAVEAGVALSGTARAPRIRLVSNPDVPDAEKLAWMTLGHGLSNASGNEYGAMQVAAAALLSRTGGTGLQSQIARSVGLDEFGVGGGGTLEGAVVTFGKRLARNVYLAYERSLAGTANLVRIQYELSKRWSVQARAGAETSIDLFYSLGID